MKIIAKLIFLLLIICFNSCLVTNLEQQQKSPYFGMAKYNEKIYIDITEVTVDEWLEYYKWILENKGEKESISALPDSNNVSVFVWEYIEKEKKRMKKSAGAVEQNVGTYYLEDCNEIVENDRFYQRMYNKKKMSPCPYGIEPIVGLTYEQVVDYCKWKTILKGKDKTIYRLPTKEEWVQFAINGLSESEKLKFSVDSLCAKDQNCHVYNYKNTFKDLNENASSIIKVAEFAPNKKGIYDLFGNISEMTMTKGEAKGGNYNIFASQCHIDSIQYYNRPEKWLGFRCIAEEE